MKSAKQRIVDDQVALSTIIARSKIPAHEKERRRSLIHSHVLSNSNNIAQPDFKTISPCDLGMLFHATDELYFEGRVGQLCERMAARPLSFRLSTRMTTTGGMTTMLRDIRRSNSRPEFEIAIATTPIFESFSYTNQSLVGGLVCHDRLQALQRIMEHEMVHLIELLLTDDSNCSAEPFKRIVRDFFGHTQSNHNLLTPRDTAKTQLGLAPGDRVQFDSNGRTILGVLHRVTKRATVLVPDPQGSRFNNGHRYAKYYVPLRKLQRA